MKHFNLATVNTINEKCVPETEQSKIFKMKKIESLAFQELVNHSCLDEGECPNPLEPKFDQKLQNEVYHPFLRWKF